MARVVLGMEVALVEAEGESGGGDGSSRQVGGKREEEGGDGGSRGQILRRMKRYAIQSAVATLHTWVASCPPSKPQMAKSLAGQ